jgi:hypothetical protein
MALRANHYDAAFEAYLREARVPYVVVDEARRALWNDVSLKSLDFVVYSPTLGNLLVDVKGRRCPARGEPGRPWENWATADDLDSMTRWEQVFGGSFRGLLVFAYHLPAAPLIRQPTAMFAFRDRTYGFYGVWAEDYRRLMRTRSPKWETVWLPSGSFRDLRFPLGDLAAPAPTTVP